MAYRDNPCSADLSVWTVKALSPAAHGRTATPPKVFHHGGSVDVKPSRERLDRRPTLAPGDQFGDVLRAEPVLLPHAHHHVPGWRRSDEETRQDLAARHERVAGVRKPSLSVHFAVVRFTTAVLDHG